MPQYEGMKSRVLLEHLLNSGDLTCFQFFFYIYFLLGLLLKALLWSFP